MQRAYAGVGSRETPMDIKTEMTELARTLARQEWILRSGGAPGADMAFELGVPDPNQKSIFIPWNGFQSRYHGKYGALVPPQHLDTLLERTAQTVMMPDHWARCSQGARRLHSRNCLQVLGAPKLVGDGWEWPNKSKFVVCWTEGGHIQGGTATAIKLAMNNDIPVVNMGAQGWDHKLRELARTLGFTLD